MSDRVDTTPGDQMTDEAEVQQPPPEAARAAAEKVSVRQVAPRVQLALKMVLWVAAAIVALRLPATLSYSDLYLLNAALITAVAGLGLNLLMGYTGQVSIGNAAFLGIGAYAAVKLDEAVNLPLPLSVLAGGATAALISFGVGIPSLRLRGLYLAIGTLALHFIAVYAFQRIQGDQESGFLVDVPLYPLEQWYWIALGFLAVCTFLVWNLLRSRLGRAFVAVRSSELAADGMGINVNRTKLLSFALSGFLVGMSGALLSSLQGTVNWETYSLDLAFVHLAIVIIGGMGYLYAGLLGSLVVMLLPRLIGWFDLVDGPDEFLLHDAAYGALIVIFLLAKPGGLSVLISDLVKLVLGAVGLRQTTAVRSFGKDVDR